MSEAAQNTKKYEARPITGFRLDQTPGGEWQLTMRSGHPVPATDVEVALWKRVVQLEAENRAMKKGGKQ